MKKIPIILLTILFLGVGALSASATPALYDWAFNIDGTLTVAPNDYDTSGMPVDGSLDAEGLGTLTWSTNVAGDHSFIAFFDHEIDEALNTYLNEFGDTSGTPEAGQSWEIDEPGYGTIPDDNPNNPDYYGDIYDNVINWWLDDRYYYDWVDNHYLTNYENPISDDVSWAMGWDFNLAADETADITLILGDTEPLSGFYLSQTDPATGIPGIDYSPKQTIYFSSSLTVTGGTTPVPEPATMVLLGTGLMGLCAVSRKRRLKKK